jgi:hypothetical protein
VVVSRKSKVRPPYLAMEFLSWAFLSGNLREISLESVPLLESLLTHNPQPPAAPASVARFSFHTMGKTPASTRAGRTSKSKHPERKWCTCQERCNGGKEVAASTYRSHNPAARAATVRDGFKDGPVVVVGGKRKAESDADGLGSEGGLRETRRTRARRVAQKRGAES